MTHEYSPVTAVEGMRQQQQPQQHVQQQPQQQQQQHVQQQHQQQQQHPQHPQHQHPQHVTSPRKGVSVYSCGSEKRCPSPGNLNSCAQVRVISANSHFFLVWSFMFIMICFQSQFSVFLSLLAQEHN